MVLGFADHGHKSISTKGVFLDDIQTVKYEPFGHTFPDWLFPAAEFTPSLNGPYPILTCKSYGALVAATGAGRLADHCLEDEFYASSAYRYDTYG